MMEVSGNNIDNNSSMSSIDDCFWLESAPQELEPEASSRHHQPSPPQVLLPPQQQQPPREDPALEQLEEAILLLPLPLKAAYLEALQNCPALIPIESNPLLYLVFCNYNLWSAAERLAHYWTQRRLIFGPDRAFLPLNLSGQGALTPEDIALIQRGSLMITSPNYFILDHSLSNGGAGFSCDAQIRQAFFVWNTMSQLQGKELFASEQQQQQQQQQSNDNHHKFNTSNNHHHYQDQLQYTSETLFHDGVAVFRGPHRSSRKFSAALSELLHRVFPLKTRRIHAVTLRGLNGGYLLAVLSRAMSKFGLSSDRFIAHACHSAADAAAQLARYDIGDHQLPFDTLGGTLHGPAHWAVFLHTHAKLPLEGPHDLVGLYGGLSYAEAVALWPRVAPQISTSVSTAAPIIMKTTGSAPPLALVPMLETHFHQQQHQLNINNSSFNTAIERGLRNLKDAIDMLLPSEKASYQQARKQYHNNHNTDTGRQELLSFLRYCDFDTWSAAKRLALYWKERHAVFQDRAFGPLSEIAVTKKSQNMAYLLPKDRLGRTVLCLDWGEFCGASQPERLQALFQLEARIVSEHDARLQDGSHDHEQHNPNGMAVLILVQRGGGSLTSTLAQQLAGSSQQLGSVVRDALRLPSSEFHVICPSEEVSFIRSWILPLALPAYGSPAQQDEESRWMVHDSQAPDLLGTLEAFGLGRNSLPQVVGGDCEAPLLSSTSCLPTSSSCSSLSSSTTSSVPQAPPDDSPVPVHTRQDNPVRQDSPVPVQTRQDSPLPFDSPSPTIKSVVSPSPNLVDEVHEVFKKIYDFPLQQREAYQKAMAQSPSLVKKESDVHRFLRFTDYNVPLAAEMLLRYWQQRQDVFGSRALLPLNQTYEGCLERKDVAILQTGILYNLPCLTPEQDDVKSVLFCDGSNLQSRGKINERSLMRCMFYMWSVMAENEASQQEGFQLLYLVSKDSSSFNKAFRKCLDVVLGCIPARVERVHFLNLDTPVDQFDSAVELLDMSAVTHRHCVSHRNDLAQALAGFGFSKEFLPVSVAGEWGYKDFVKWQELRVRHEWGLFIKPDEEDKASQYNIPPCPFKVDDTTEGRAERKRRMMIVHSRCKRERQKMAAEDLREQTMHLEDEQSQLTRDHMRLSGLLHQAQSLVSMFATASSK